MKEPLLPTLRVGMTNPFVSFLKELLNRYVPNTHLHVDNQTFGPDTQLAVWNFQQSRMSLKNDGVCGPKTWNALLSAGDPSAFQVGVRKLLEKYVRASHLRKSTWKFVTSEGKGLSEGLLLGVGLEKGNLFLSLGDSGPKHAIRFRVAGLTASLSSPIDGTLSTKNFLSVGEILLGPHHKSELALHEFSGPIVCVSAGSHLAGGWNVSQLYFGLPGYDLALFALIPTVLLAPIFAYRIHNDAKAIAVVESQLIGIAGAGMGVMEGRATVL